MLAFFVIYHILENSSFIDLFREVTLMTAIDLK